MKKNEAHIWLWEDSGEKIAAESLHVLEAPEKIRFEKYLTPAKQREFLLGKLLTRYVLSQYLETEPEKIEIFYNAKGKPFLSGNKFFFNLSHSGRMLAVIVAKSQTGIDVEYMRRSILRDHYEHIFTSGEISALSALTGEARLERFFQLWTLKEAYWKALDFAATLPFNGFSFTFDPIAVHPGSVPLPEMNWNFSVGLWRENFMLATATEMPLPEPFVLKQFELETLPWLY